MADFVMDSPLLTFWVWQPSGPPHRYQLALLPLQDQRVHHDKLAFQNEHLLKKEGAKNPEHL